MSFYQLLQAISIIVVIQVIRRALPHNFISPLLRIPKAISQKLAPLQGPAGLPIIGTPDLSNAQGNLLTDLCLLVRLPATIPCNEETRTHPRQMGRKIWSNIFVLAWKSTIRHPLRTQCREGSACLPERDIFLPQRLPYQIPYYSSRTWDYSYTIRCKMASVIFVSYFPSS